jgi:hypothetical protein
MKPGDAYRFREPRAGYLADFRLERAARVGACRDVCTAVRKRS